MHKITLNDVEVINNRINYNYSVDDALCRHFNLHNSFSIEFYINDKEMDISSVPKAILSIPFVCNVLPIIWIEDAELVIPELDDSFYKCIPEFKQGYINMFPDVKFLGKISVGKLINNTISNSKRSAAFFSGGLDATTTLLRHIDEKPDLISVWGSDIEYDNSDGWKPVHTAIKKVADFYSVNHIVIRSTFRIFDRENELDNSFQTQLHDSWWHGIKHGIGLLGHAAPYAWLYNLGTIYIASSNCPEDGQVTCASNPTIDNYVRFCGANVIHDGFELSRQKKAAFLVRFHKKNPKIRTTLHVCWESKDGNNCCNCEKCYRTITAIYVEGGNPQNYGFDVDTSILKKIYKKMALQYQYSKVISIQWEQIKQRINQTQSSLKNRSYYKDLLWIRKYNFFDPNSNWCRKLYQIKHTKSLRGKLSYLKTYQLLRQIKKTILHDT